MAINYQRITSAAKTPLRTTAHDAKAYSDTSRTNFDRLGDNLTLLTKAVVNTSEQLNTITITNSATIAKHPPARTNDVTSGLESATNHRIETTPNTLLPNDKPDTPNTKK